MLLGSPALAILGFRGAYMLLFFVGGGGGVNRRNRGTRNPIQPSLPTHTYPETHRDSQRHTETHRDTQRHTDARPPARPCAHTHTHLPRIAAELRSTTCDVFQFGWPGTFRFWVSFFCVAPVGFWVLKILKHRNPQNPQTHA